MLDGTALNWCQQEVLRAQMSNTVLFGKVKDPELVVDEDWNDPEQGEVPKWTEPD